MKNLILILICFLVLPGCTIAGINLTWHEIVAIIAGLYEVIIRIIPTVGNYSLIGKIIEILKWISDFLNKKKK